MVLFRLLFHYLRRKYRKKRAAKRRRLQRQRRRRERRNVLNDCDDVENNEDVDVVDGDSDSEEEIVVSKRSFFGFVILFWSIYEVLSLPIVLIRIDGIGYRDNFLNGFCESRECENIVSRFICYKLVVGVLLLIGAKYVCKIGETFFFCFNIL